MPLSRNHQNQKKRSLKRTQRVESLFLKLEQGLLSLSPLPNTKNRVLTILNPNDDCFHSNRFYLYIGTPLSQFKKFRKKAKAKLGKAEIPVCQTINSSRNRYSIKDPFVVFHVITIDDTKLQEHGVDTVRQLEEKIRKDLGFIADENFDGDEFWKNKGLEELINDVDNYIFHGEPKQTFQPRIPQQIAIEKIIKSFSSYNNNEFLFGAIMRFGKNFTFLYAITEVLKKNTTAKILVWTNKPGVFNSLEKDVRGHIKFIDYTYVSLRESKDIKTLPSKCVVTASRQLLENQKNQEIMDFIESQDWDFIVIDECHNGVETQRATDFLYKFKKTKKIFISGTPQKQLGKIQFTEKNTFIYDEICQKKDKELGIWSDAIILQTHLIKLSSESVTEYKKCCSEETGYFTFTKFFSHKKGVGLIYQQSVIKFFMDFFGYNKIEDSYNFFGKHTNVAILVPSNVLATKELANVLRNSILGKDYEIVSATGKEFCRSQLKKALLSGKKTITFLSDMLIEGETIPEWDCTINMSDGTSIFKYLQFAFRPTNPNSENPNKEAFFYDMNPQRHFLIQNERMKLKGLKGIEREVLLRSWYKNFKIMISENVQGTQEVDFESLRKDFYHTDNMMRSLNTLISWNRVNLSEIKNDFDSIHKQTINTKKVLINDHGIGDGKNSFSSHNKKNEKNLSDKELKEIKEKIVTVLSRVPYVLYREKCENLSNLLELFRGQSENFFGAFGVSQEIFEKYWFNEDFIDRNEMDFYFKNFASSI